jgi:hypothetical protein
MSAAVNGAERPWADDTLLGICKQYAILLEWVAALAKRAQETGKQDRTIEAVLAEADMLRERIARTRPQTLRGLHAAAESWIADRPVDPPDTLALTVIQAALALTGGLWLCLRMLAHYADEFWPTLRGR